MTVITKAIIEKKAGDNMEQPLVIEDDAEAQAAAVAAEPGKQQEDVAREARKRRCLVMKLREIHRSATMASCFLSVIAFLILIIGVYCGLYIYTQFARPQIHGFRTGWYSIPYDGSSKSYADEFVQQGLVMDSVLCKYGEDTLDAEKNIEIGISKYFKERFEIDLERGDYEKIEVPDFRGGRRGRFIHDFNINKTGIIDIDGQCCFVMPLNRQRVLPPRNMFDLLRKMYNGDYDVDTEIVRETMKVVTPPITDLSVVGNYIARECQNLPTYMLRKVNPNVVKRSASSGVFGQFAGKTITEIDILNLEVVEAYTEHPPK